MTQTSPFVIRLDDGNTPIAFPADTTYADILLAAAQTAKMAGALRILRRTVRSEILLATATADGTITEARR